MLFSRAGSLPFHRQPQQQQPRPMSAPDPSSGGVDSARRATGSSLLQRFRALRLAAPRAAERGAVAASAKAASAAPVAAQQQQQQQHKQQPPEHLIVLVNGLFGGPSNWDVAAAALAAELKPPPPSSSSSSPPPSPLIVASAANSRARTYDGIDTCGQRLADEVRLIAAQHPSLKRLSFVAHSMGGLMARFAAGVLFDPRTKTVAGLEPSHFLTLATPHMGCDAGAGVSQVPFVGWASRVLPAKGVELLQGVSAPVAAALFRRTGKQFFLEDGKTAGRGGKDDDDAADLPLLARLARDDPSTGLFFLSALSSFRTRTAVANVSGDHLVSWCNASLRGVGQLPLLPPPPPRQTTTVAGGGEQTASASSSTPSSCRYVVREDPLAAAFFEGDPAVARAASSNGGAAAAAGAWHTEEAAAAIAVVPGGDGSVEDDDALPTADDAVVAAVEQEARAAEEDLAAGLRAGSPPLAAALAAREHPSTSANGNGQGNGNGDPHPLVGISHPQRASMVADMLVRLSALPWRRVDVCFSTGSGGGGGLSVFGLAHNNIQVTRRLLNSEGEAVVAHLARTFREMDEAVAEAASDGRGGSERPRE